MKTHILLIALTVFCLLPASCGQKNNTARNTTHRTITPRKVNVILFGNFPEARANYFVTELRKVIPVVEITKVHEELPASAWYAPRKRYLAIKILDYMKTFTPEGTISLGLTTKDISQMRGETDWGIMGLSYKPGKTVIISTKRLNQQRINQQGVKLCLHELGHAQGLNHCDKSPTCIMRDAKGRNHFDELTGFCDSCTMHLKGKGWKL